MEQIPEPEKGVDRKRWTTPLKCLISAAFLAIYLVHILRPDVISQTLMWLILIPAALCVGSSICLMRNQAQTANRR